MQEPEGFLRMYRERFILALAKNYCEGQISWDEYARTTKVVQVIFSELADEVGQLRERHLKDAG